MKKLNTPMDAGAAGINCDSTITPVKNIIFGREEIEFVISNALNINKSISIKTHQITKERQNEVNKISLFLIEYSYPKTKLEIIFFGIKKILFL
tara:strand:+ start:102 stop:383 length:282 start_codon:yes stop_codon:yes gene_type:complete